jgi:molybdopterin-containing oxidoreductase family membrane subunit
MFEHAFKGSLRYWALIFLFGGLFGVGFLTFLYQYMNGLQVTGMSRDVSWGLYIGQLTFFVGVAASAVMVVLPYYLHNFKAFGRMTVLGEFVAIPAVLMCMLFVLVDLGQPARMMNLFLHPTPNSMLFWDTVALFGYLGLNILITWFVFGAERKGVPAPRWIKFFIILSVPWAFSIHTVTAFLYAGLGARPFWMTAVLAPRFLASAFAAGPSLLILLALIVRKFTTFDPGKEAIQQLGRIATYAMAANIFLVGMELFTALYSGIPEHLHHFEYLYVGLGEADTLVPWMWTSAILGVAAMVMLFVPSIRRNETYLAWAAAMIFISLWIDKGLGMVVAGYVPSPLGAVTEYWPTLPEWMIVFGIWALGLLLITVFYKIVISVREQAEQA